MADLRPVYVAGDGDVKGPASSSSNFLPLFAGTTGKLLKSSGTGVTAQGLAILDDNTPAEQRNTIGLDQVNNTSDVNKPVSTAQQKALDLKANKIDLDKVNNTSDINKPISTSQQNALNLKADKIHLDKVNNTYDINKPVSIPQQKALDLKADKINLSQVNNTSDVNKPVSTAQQTALNLKQDKLQYTPVQQGGGIGQTPNKIFIGYGAGRLKATVDSTDFGNVVFDGNTATESVVGVTKVATQALTNGGVDDTTIVTPKKLRFGFLSLFAAHAGYIFLPSWLGGWGVQWGRSSGTGAHTIAFPTPFPNQCLNAYATPNSASPSTGSIYVNYPALTASRGAFVCGNTNGASATNTYAWLAVGN